MDAAYALTGLLLSDAGLTGLVGDRVHWMRLPDLVNGRPYINLQVISEPQFYLHGAGVSAYKETFVQADAWAVSWSGAREVSEALVAAVGGYRGIYQGCRFHGIWVTGQRDLDGATTGGESQLFRRNVDLKISWQLET